MIIGLIRLIIKMDNKGNNSDSLKDIVPSQSTPEVIPKKRKINFDDIFVIIAIFIFVIQFSIFSYFAFIGIISLAVYLLLYEWLSLFSKRGINLIFSILGNFSEFGVFYVLFLYITLVIKIYLSNLVIVLKNATKAHADYLDIQNEIKYSKFCSYFKSIMTDILIFGIMIALGYLIFNSKSRFIISCILECFLLFFLSVDIYLRLHVVDEEEIMEALQPFKSAEASAAANDDTEKEKNEENMKLEDININVENDKDGENNSEDGDVIIESPPDFFESHPRIEIIYKITSYLIIIGLQGYMTVYLPITEQLSAGWICLFVFVKLLFLFGILKFNFIDIIVNFKKRYKTIKHSKGRIVHIIVIVLYAVLFFFFIAIYFYSKKAVFPAIKSAKYFENEKIWYKINQNQTISPEGFCFNQAQKDGTLHTEDFAMLTTLPRLYGVSDDGKCFIKPSKRGLFNTTMKYIFGKDYEKEGIVIMCKKITHFPVLIITSDRIKNRTLSYFSNDSEITFLENQFDIENKNFFENHEIGELPIEGENLLKSYQRCVEKNGPKNCENEWDSFTQFYWPNMYSNEYADIPGFERYQINIESNMTIQPSFITGEGQLWSGTHYIVGGGYEDRNDVGFLIETVGRQYIPKLFDNVLPFYSLISGLDKETFLRMVWFNSKLFYLDIFSSKETKKILELYKQFNFTHQALFTVGHSITGTIFKAASFYSDIQGITFEAADGENNINFISKSKLKTSSYNQIINIYSKNSIFTGFDKNLYINGMLPKRYMFPNVYDTACMTAITCSETEKYVSFCKQVLSQNTNISEEEFNISFNAYLNNYGYHI